MVLSSSLVPQADIIWDVALLVEGVAHGKNGDLELGHHIGKNDRQGRYYRLAAENIGLLAPVHEGVSTLTTSGTAYASETDPGRKRQILVDGVMSNDVFRGLLNYIREAGGSGRSRMELEMWLATNTTLSGTTPHRRVNTVASWLVDLGLAHQTGTTYVLNPAAFPMSAVAPEEPDPHAPLPTTPPALVPFNGVQPMPTKAVPGDMINYWVDRAEMERANQEHEQLVGKVAKLATDSGYECRRNQFVDLFASSPADANLFEMKTNNPGNTVSQVRKAVAQLYEYQYQQSLGESGLVVVLEQEPTGPASWTVDYLTSARGILPVWESGDVFTGPTESAVALPWLM